jgi:hypothetical protein
MTKEEKAELRALDKAIERHAGLAKEARSKRRALLARVRMRKSEAPAKPSSAS